MPKKRALLMQLSHRCRMSWGLPRRRLDCAWHRFFARPQNPRVSLWVGASRVIQGVCRASPHSGAAGAFLPASWRRRRPEGAGRGEATTKRVARQILPVPRDGPIGTLVLATPSSCGLRPSGWQIRLWACDARRQRAMWGGWPCRIATLKPRLRTMARHSSLATLYFI